MSAVFSGTCGGCRFGVETKMQLHCYLNPPVAHLIAGPSLDGGMGVNVLCVRPVVEKEQFCGSFLPKIH